MSNIASRLLVWIRKCLRPACAGDVESLGRAGSMT